MGENLTVLIRCVCGGPNGLDYSAAQKHPCMLASGVPELLVVQFYKVDFQDKALFSAM
jgi:hypothetical protein